MRKISLVACFFVIFLELGLIFPNQYTGSKTSVCLVSPNQGNPYYSWSTFGEDIGYKYNSTAQASETARAKYAFDFSGIPSNATISNVSLSLSAGNYQNSQYKYTITQLSGNIVNPSDLWNGIHSSTALFTNILYSSGNPSGSYTALTTLINNNKGGNIYLGVYSQNEGNSDSYANLNITLNMDVSVPPSNITITADNNFNISPANDGLINVTGYGQKTAPFPFQINVGQTASFTAISGQTDAQNYQRVWSTSAPVYNSQWREYKASGPIQLNNTITNITYTTVPLTTNDNTATFEAGLRKVCNVPVQNNMVGLGNVGTIIVNGTQYNLPTNTFQVIEQNPITVTPQNQTINGIDYTFSSWYNSTTQNPNTFYPGDNSTISANFIGKPNTVNRSLHFNASNPNQPITVLWNEHPNTNVTQYQIWRKVNYKKQGVSSPVLIGTVNRGTLNFVDYDYSGTNLGYTDYMLWYDVKPYYSIESTVSVDNYVTVFSNGLIAKQGQENKGNVTESILANKIENYPNPFNPSTVITYQIVNQGHVSLKVYDCLGREIAELVNEEQNSGKYNVIFNVDNLASGIYFYRIVANGYVETKKMIRMK
jgi:hypothetical protein